MKIGVIGAGHIGGNIARRMAGAGHEVVVSYSRDLARLDALAVEIGGRAGSPADAATADVVVLSVPWGQIDDARSQAGDLTGRIVIDTTNQFGPDGPITWADGRTAARHNADRMPGARYTKSFNTLTAAFQASRAGRTGRDRVVQWVCGDDADAKVVVMRLIADAGFEPVDLGGIDACSVMEAPRRRGAVYGEEYHLDDAALVVAAVRSGQAIPPTPRSDDIEG